MLKTADIIFEDDWVLVVDKKSGVVVNRSETIRAGTLQDDLAIYFGLVASDLGIGDRAGIVHRLDRETSGLLVAAKTKAAFKNLQAQFKSREVDKKYIALVHGSVGDKSGSVESKIARVGKFGKFGVVQPRLVGTIPSRDWTGLAREARTDYEVEAYFQHKFFRGPTPLGAGPLEGLTKSRIRYLKRQAKDYTLVNVFPKTGRTHQIRVHLKYIGHPVVSDLIYGPHKLISFDLSWCPRLFLHAGFIEFMHPKTKKRVKFYSDLPNDLKHAILSLKEVKS